MERKKSFIISALIVVITVIITNFVIHNNENKNIAHEKTYYELDPTITEQYIEVVVNAANTYTIYSYATLEDYNNGVNKTLLDSINYAPENEFKIHITDIVKGDYPSDDSSNSVLTEDFEKNKFMNVRLTQETSDLVMLSGDNREKIYFQVGYPLNGKEFQLIPLFSTTAKEFVVECRLSYGEYADEVEEGYSFFASIDNETDLPTNFILGNRTAQAEELYNLD